MPRLALARPARQQRGRRRQPLLIPKKASTALNAGLTAYNEGDLTEAAAQYEVALKYDAANKYAWYNLGILDEADSNYGLAAAKYRKALESDPAYGPALYNLAILRTQSDPQEAMTLYRAALDADPKDADAWLNLGLLLRKDGQTQAGYVYVLHALTLDHELKDPAKTTS